MIRAVCRAAGLVAALLLTCCSPTESPPSGPVRLLERTEAAVVANETRVSAPAEEASLRSTLRLPADAVLEFGYGIRNRSLQLGARAARFRVSVERGDERWPLFEGRVDPARARQRRWFDMRADLAAHAGERVTLVFEATPEPGPGPAPVVAWSEPVVYSAGESSTLPNVVVVSLDTLRARSVGLYGYARDTTPFLDALAREAAVFEDAITTSVTTGPSHMSLFTGLYPVNHGLRTGLDYKLPDVATLASRLREAGYQTAAFTENGYIVRMRGFGEGFARYTENAGDRRRGPGEVRVTFRQARRWLAANARRPFFLFLHTYEVHAPFEPPEEYRDLFVGDGAPGPEDPVLLQARDDYDREIRFVDDKLRELFDSLEANGLRDSTLVVILADHGEEFGEHGLYQHGGAVFEETLHIPLIWVGPGVVPGRHPGPASLIDVTPTLLELAGLPLPDGLDGRSLADAIREGAKLEPRTLFAEARARRRWLRPSRGERWNPPLIAVRSGDTKFIVHRPDEGEALPPARYDLARDALERAPDPVEGEALRSLNALVDEYLAGRMEASARREPDAPESLDPELRHRLQLLGYLE